ncbi:MAG TPA: hypothetical protein VFQ87_00340, partial [Bradyrhizobium sp.]|nr:hypothetical protein [Bradyrhizobium sp.]
EWQQRLIGGVPVEVRFECDINPRLDCHAALAITNRREGDRWCETIRKDGDATDYPEHWCNGDPEAGIVSVYGARFSFDEEGKVSQDGRVVGQMSVPPPEQPLVYDEWQQRLIGGVPVEVRFECDINPRLDCHAALAITNRREGDRWCETIRKDGETTDYPEHWCNGDPEAGIVSVYGAMFSFDEEGKVSQDGKVIGQLFVPPPEKPLYNDWQQRLIGGVPVEVRFECGANVAFDCHVALTVTYRKEGDRWCETIRKDGEATDYPEHWCNGDPEAGIISLYGARFSFDDEGYLSQDGRRAAQMSAASPSGESPLH